MSETWRYIISVDAEVENEQDGKQLGFLLSSRLMGEPVTGVYFLDARRLDEEEEG